MRCSAYRGAQHLIAGRGDLIRRLVRQTRHLSVLPEFRLVLVEAVDADVAGVLAGHISIFGACSLPDLEPVVNERHILALSERPEASRCRGSGPATSTCRTWEAENRWPDRHS